MNDFFNSKFVTDLKDGTLPTMPVEVEIQTESLLLMGIVLLICGGILVAGYKLIK